MELAPELKEVFDQQKYDRLTNDLEKRLARMTERQRLEWLKKKRKKYSKKMVAKCLK